MSAVKKSFRNYLLPSLFKARTLWLWALGQLLFRRVGPGALEKPLPSEWRRLLILVPHPDDEVLGLLYCLEAEHQIRDIWILYLSAGDRNPAREAHQSASTIRKAEAIRGLKDYNVAQRFLQYTDGGMLHQVERIASSIETESERFAPDAILAPAPNDSTPDHRAVSDAGEQVASRKALPLVYFRSTSKTFALRDADFIYTGSFKNKLRALRVHKSQFHIALTRSVAFDMAEAARLGFTRDAEGFLLARPDVAWGDPTDSLKRFSRWLRN